MFIPPQVQQIAKEVEAGQRPETSVRTLLTWFGAQRRGYWVVKRITSALAKLGIRTWPDFRYAYIDDAIFFRKEEPAEKLGFADEQTTTPGTVPETEGRTSRDSPFSDPTYRIGKLPAANKKPLSVPPDAPLLQAITHMLANDYSQLPVITGERSVKGAISWKSIGARLVLRKACETVSDCLEHCEIVSSDVSIFHVIEQVAKHEFVLVEDISKSITGIVTTSDLTVQFGQLAEPFLLLGEVENHIRRLIDGRFTVSELRVAIDPSDAGREVDSIADLTFGEYLRLMEQPERWQKVGIDIDRRVFVKQLEEIRRIRNDVMHFDPDGVAEQDFESLRKFVRFLNRLRSLTS